MNADYIYLADINTAPCVSAKKEHIAAAYPHIDQSRIFVVVKEIESWYLAGLDENKCRSLKVRSFANTEQVGKEQFEALVPKKRSLVEFKIEVLRRFSIEVARQKNRSFDYFAHHIGL